MEKKIDGAEVVQGWLKDIEERENDMPIFRYRGLRKDGELIESNDIEDFKIQDFYWFEEIATMTPEMYENLRLKSNLPPLSNR